tara:strand:+ start:276 stop:518 length:243 start_codon:yes stop_codon:yes gene_type:complete
VKEKNEVKNLNQEEKQEMLENVRSREIVQTIMDYGVSQHQIKKIIEFLAMELEERDIMLGVCKVLLDSSESDSMKTNIEV